MIGGDDRAVTLIEKAQTSLDQEQALGMAQKLVKGEFNLEDFLQQLQQMKKFLYFQAIEKKEVWEDLIYIFAEKIIAENGENRKI